MFPRGGGVWDQNPILMRDFRIIRRFDIEWKNDQARIQESKSRGGMPGEGGGVGGLGSALNEYISTLEEEG